MKYILLNPYSSAGTAEKKWEKIAGHFREFELRRATEMNDLIQVLQPGDTIISAGGDGLLHGLVNSLIQHHGLEDLKNFKVGYIALGSNNGYLQPLHKQASVFGIGHRTSHLTLLRDLIEVRIGESGQQKSVFIVSNGSMGLLAQANECFNSSRMVQLIKKLSLSMGDISAFTMALAKFRALHLTIELPVGESKVKSRQLWVSNLHFLKSPYFTKDLAFPTKSELDSGSFDFFILGSKNRRNLLKRFLKMMALSQVNEGFDETQVIPSFKVTAREETLLETDGEIQRGQKFEFFCHEKKLRACL